MPCTNHLAANNVQPQALDKEAKTEVDQAVEEAKASPEPKADELWSEVYVKGTEPSFMRGREREEVRSFGPNLPSLSLTQSFLGTPPLKLTIVYC